MTEELEDKCGICKREILNKEICRAILDGKLGVDYYHDGKEVIFYDDDDQSDTVLICDDCTAEHVNMLVYGRELVKALRGIRDDAYLSYECACRVWQGKDKYTCIRCLARKAIAKIEGSKADERKQT